MIVIVMRQKIQVLIVCLACSVTTIVCADETRIYRWVAEDGSVTFSSQPPPAGIKGEAMDVPTPRQVIVQDPNVLQRQLQKSEALGAALDEQRQQREQSQQNLKAAEAELQAAEQALAEGREPKPGEMQRIPTGARLLPSYAERIKQLEAAVAEAKKRIEELKK